MSATARELSASRVQACLAESARDLRVEEVRIGLRYTAVLLEGGRLGVAYTFSDQARGGCSVFQVISSLLHRPAAELLRLLGSRDLIEAALGLACANALANCPGDSYLTGDVLDHLALEPDDHVGMVGHFRPLLGPLQQRVRQVTVFERVSEPVGLLRPREEALAVLPRCQIALITATALINGTAESLLVAAEACREVVVLGPSTPLVPRAFGGTSASLLSGVVVRDPQAVLRVVSGGGGTRGFSPFVNKVSLRIKE